MATQADLDDKGEGQSKAEAVTVSFDRLANGAAEVVISHQGKEYRLRTTRNGGLILNR